MDPRDIPRLRGECQGRVGGGMSVRFDLKPLETSRVSKPAAALD